jgi:hypothetical protein
MMPFGHDPATPHALAAYGRGTVVPFVALALLPNRVASSLGIDVTSGIRLAVSINLRRQLVPAPSDAGHLGQT